MAKSAKSRIDNWLVRMQGEAMSGSAKQVLDPTKGISATGTAAYINATEAMCAREEMVRGYLGEQGVKTILNAAYLAFGRQLFSLEHRGYTLNAGKGSPGYLEAAALKEKWTVKGPWTRQRSKVSCASSDPDRHGPDCRTSGQQHPEPAFCH